MKTKMLAGAACAALMTLAAPASGADVPSTSAIVNASATGAVASFYAHSGNPLWLRDGPDSAAARELLTALRGAALDNMPSGPAMAAQASALLNRARAGDAAALKNKKPGLAGLFVGGRGPLAVASRGWPLAPPEPSPACRHPLPEERDWVCALRLSLDFGALYLRSAQTVDGGAWPLFLGNLIGAQPNSRNTNSHGRHSRESGNPPGLVVRSQNGFPLSRE